MYNTVQMLMNHGVAVLFVAVLVEQAGLPTPVVPLLLAVGSLARMGHVNLVSSILVAMIACLFADFFWYQVGRRHSRSHLSIECAEGAPDNSKGRKMIAAFHRYGAAVLLLAKFVPGPNLASPLAGISGFTPTRFLFFDTLASILWAGGYITVGYCFAEPLQQLTHYGLHI